VIEAVRRSPQLASCSLDDCAAIVEAAEMFTLPTTWAFIRQGTPADACYLLLSGSVRVFDGRRPVAALGPSEIVGEMALFGGGIRRATVASLGPVTGLRLDFQSLERLFRAHPAVGEAVHRAYLSRLSAA
jgi:CRP-like cAMP-binding protein